MRYAEFSESNKVFKGGDLKDEWGRPVGDLPVFQDQHKIISKWTLSWRERLRVLFKGHLWLHILGQGLPPVLLDTEYPFEVVDPEAE